MNPNLNVGLPIFTIHGNHDDPSGSDNLSAVDILSSCKLVNYFGKHMLSGASGQRLTISPILIQKVRRQQCIAPTAALSQPSVSTPVPLPRSPWNFQRCCSSYCAHIRAHTLLSFQHPPHLPIATHCHHHGLAQLYGFGSIQDNP